MKTTEFREAEAATYSHCTYKGKRYSNVPSDIKIGDTILGINGALAITTQAELSGILDACAIVQNAQKLSDAIDEDMMSENHSKEWAEIFNQHAKRMFMLNF